MTGSRFSVGNPLTPPAPRTCPGCSKPFTPALRRQRYCSSSCALTARAEQQRQRRDAMLVPRPCPQCGVHFTPDRRGRKYCSGACARTVQSHIAAVREETLPEREKPAPVAGEYRDAASGCPKCSAWLEWSAAERLYTCIACSRRYAAEPVVPLPWLPYEPARRIRPVVGDA